MQRLLLEYGFVMLFDECVWMFRQNKYEVKVMESLHDVAGTAREFM